MKEFRSYIDDETGERVSGLFDMSEEQINALEASRNAPSPTPHSISDRQFAHQLKKLGIITHVEALAFVQTGTLPTAILNIVEAIEDQGAREDAEILISGAVEFQRYHPLTQAIATASGWSSEDTDNFFRAASLL